MHPDYTMIKIIKMMKERKLTVENIHKLCAVPMSKKISEDDLKKSEEDLKSAKRRMKDSKREKKKMKLKINQKPKKTQVKRLKTHIAYLESMGFYNKENFKDDMPTTPSFSMMHALKDGFQILMYSGSHRVKLSPERCLHNLNAVRIVLPEHMAIIWHESLFHAGAKSRQGLEDLRFFSYVWPENYSKKVRRTKGTSDGVAREIGEQVYRSDITNLICKDLYKDKKECLQCRSWEQIIDLREIPKTSYQPGQRIIGCLETLGWIVVRGVPVTEETYRKINIIAEAGTGGRPARTPKWYSIEDRNNNRVMKYRHDSKPHANWNKDDSCKQFLNHLQTKVLDKVFKKPEFVYDIPEDSQYILGKYNLLKNNGNVSMDQQAHTDYPNRLPT